MTDNFQFLVICEALSHWKGEAEPTPVIRGVVQKLTTTEDRLELRAVIGLALLGTAEPRPPLLLTSHQLAGTTRIPIATWEVTLPATRAALVISRVCTLEPREAGLYGFDLRDPSGVCGPPGLTLASYLIPVTLAA